MTGVARYMYNTHVAARQMHQPFVKITKTSTGVQGTRKAMHVHSLHHRVAIHRAYSHEAHLYLRTFSRQVRYVQNSALVTNDDKLGKMASMPTAGLVGKGALLETGHCVKKARQAATPGRRVRPAVLHVATWFLKPKLTMSQT